MKKGTKITNKVYPFNPGGDHDIHFDQIEACSEVDYNIIFDDPNYFLCIFIKAVDPVTFYFSIAFDTTHQIGHTHTWSLFKRYIPQPFKKAFALLKPS